MKSIQLTENEAHLAGVIGVEMQQDLTKMSRNIMETIRATVPENVPSGVKLKRIVMHATVFYDVEGVGPEEIASSGLVTIEL